MAFLKNMPDNAVLLDVFKAFSETAKPLIEFHEVLMRGASPFTVAERELIAAYVSGLNACTYCHGVHRATAEEFGVSGDLLADLLKDVAQADVDENMRPVLQYVRKLTQNPAWMSQADADAVFAAGWDEQALHDAVMVCALFNFMNRMVEGLGIRADNDYFQLASKRLSEHGYAGLLRLLDAEDS